MSSHPQDGDLSISQHKADDWSLPVDSDQPEYDSHGERANTLSRSPTPHLDTAQLARVLSPIDSHLVRDSSRSRGNVTSFIAHSMGSPSISESGEEENPRTVCRLGKLQQYSKLVF